MQPRLPIDAIRDAVLETVHGGATRLVISAPTGTGKSTQLPRWLGALGKVLVIQPRRVACTSLADRVAQLEGAELGEAVGFAVRFASRSCARTRILFVTPGVALRMAATGDVHRYDAVILDEFHERTLDIDLLAAWLRAHYRGVLVVTSATMNADRVAAFFDGAVLSAPNPMFPVDIVHRPGRDVLPTTDGLVSAVVGAVQECRSAAGAVLVFLPGKAEIAACAAALRRDAAWHVVEMHGGMPLDAQRRAFAPAPRGKRKVVLATNVAETSLTIPDVAAVVDSGLVRRTRYRDGRAYLTTMPVAQDAADQRAGRAGRTAAGVCVRLWDARARLEPVTPPEIHRESLVPLLLAQTVLGDPVGALAYYDPPKDYAVDAAVRALRELGAVDARGAATDRGRALFSLPLRPVLAAFLLEAERTGCLEDAIDLVAAIETEEGGKAASQEKGGEAERTCDVTARVCAVRRRAARSGREGGLHAGQVAAQLRRAFGLSEQAPPATRLPDVEALVRTLLAVDPRAAFVAKVRHRRRVFTNGKQEITLAASSRVDGTTARFIAVFDTVGVASGLRPKDAHLVATCAAATTAAVLAAAGVGEAAVRDPVFDGRRITARVERVLAGVLLSQEDRELEGEWARRALSAMCCSGAWRGDLAEACRTRLERARLARALQPVEQWDVGPYARGVPDDPEAWLCARLEALGLERGEDVALLSDEDILPPRLPQDTEARLCERYPLELHLGDARYAVTYDVPRREVTLVKRGGIRKTPPSTSLLPAFSGFGVVVRHGGQVWRVKER